MFVKNPRVCVWRNGTRRTNRQGLKLLFAQHGMSRSSARYASTQETPKYDYSYDVIVVGSGCAGLTTAVVAAKNGLKTLVVEKSKFFGGTTAYSGGGAWIPVNKHQSKVGINDDSYEKADLYLHQVLGNLYEPTRVQKFLRSGPEMVSWLEKNTAMRFKPVPLPDYHVKKEGAFTARTILTKEFDGRVLGRRRLKEVRYTLQGYSAFGSMQADPTELAVLTRPFSSASNFIASARKILRYVGDLIWYGKGSYMANGNALVGRLLYSCIQEHVDLWINSPAATTIRPNGKQVTGIIVKSSSGQEVLVQARKGVVLASGGFGRSEEAKNFLPHDWCVSPKHNVGDGKRIGVESGGILPPPNPNNGIFAPISLLHTKRGPIRRFPHFAIDRSKPGSIIVGLDGRRFANESEPYQEFVKTMHRLDIKKAFFIGDRDFLRKYGMGMALPWPYPKTMLLSQGYLFKGATIQQLAAKIDVPADALAKTVLTCNNNAREGRDSEFHRGETTYDQFYGDLSTGLPNPNLGLCERGPFYALPLYPGNVSSVYGLKTNEYGQALSADGSAVLGLYAVGLDQNSVMRGEYPGGGSSIGPGMTFGYVAGMHLAGMQ